MELASIVKDNFLIVDEDASLSSVIGELKQHEKQSAIVFRNKKYVGVVDKQKVLRTNADLEDVKLDGCVENVPIINYSTSLGEAIALLSGCDSTFLPYEKDKEITGVVSSLDLMKLAVNLPESSKVLVSDIKYVKPPKVNATDSMSTAAEIMRQQHLNCVPVYSEGKLFGVVNYKDILRRLINWSPKRDQSAKFNAEMRSTAARVDTSRLTDLPIEGFIQDKDLISVSGKMSLKEALAVMEKNGISNVLVMDVGDYRGMLTSHNILVTLAKLQNVQRYSVYYVGLNDVTLSEHQKTVLESITQRQADKLQRKIEDPFSIAIHLKEINKDGKQRQFSVNVKVDINGKIHSCEKEDWDFETALHKCFNFLQMS